MNTLNSHRIFLVALIAIQGALIALVNNAVFPSWTAYLTGAATFIGGLLTVRLPPLEMVAPQKTPKPPIGLVVLALALGFFVFGCKDPATSNAVKTDVQIADNLCQEVAPFTPDPTLVSLICNTANGVVHVALPRKAWAALVADAGPGK